MTVSPTFLLTWSESNAKWQLDPGKSGAAGRPVPVHEVKALGTRCGVSPKDKKEFVKKERRERFIDVKVNGKVTPPRTYLE